MNSSTGCYLLACAMLALGLMAKSMLVTVPPLLLLLDCWPLGRCGDAADLPTLDPAPRRPGFGRLLLEKVPLAALAAGASLMTLWSHVSVEAGPPWSRRLSNAAVSTVNYLVGFFCPIDLAVFYPVPEEGYPVWKVTGSIVLLLAVSVAVIVARRRYPYLAVGWFWYLGMLVPVLGLVQVSRHGMADRYMYLPSIGLSIAVGWSVARFAASSLDRRWAVAGCGFAALAILMGLAAWQTRFWHDEVALWQHALDSTADNSEAEVGLGDALRHRDQLDAAIVHYRRALKFPCEPQAYSNLGAALAQQGQLNEAVVWFSKALQLDPDNARNEGNLGVVLAKKKQWTDAERHLTRSIELDGSVASTHFDLGHVLLAQGNIGEAIAQFESAVRLAPGDASYHHDLATAFSRAGQPEQAIPEYRAALKIAPEFLLARFNLAQALAYVGRVEDALAQCREILRIEPGNVPARQLLEKLRAAAGRPASP